MSNSTPIPVKDQNILYIIDGKKHYWPPKQDCMIPIPKQIRAKKTYLQRILDELDTNPIDYDMLEGKVKASWDEVKAFDTQYITKYIIKGIKQDKIEQIKVDGEKNKYKGHRYKLK